MVSIENKRKRDRGNRASTLGVSYSNDILRTSCSDLIAVDVTFLNHNARTSHVHVPILSFMGSCRVILT